MKKYLKAIEYFKRLIKDYPEFEVHYYFGLRGVIEVAKTDYELSITEFEELVNLVYEEDEERGYAKVCLK